MKIFSGVLLLTLCPALAGATNFEACVDDAKANNKVTTAEGYAAYKCTAKRAEKLAAGPDECPGGIKPALRSLTRKSDQLDDGLYTILSWTAGKCSGWCETRSYDSKDTTYSCEVRIYEDDGKSAETTPEAAPTPDSGEHQASTDVRRRQRRPAWHPLYGGRPAPERKSTWQSPSRAYTRRSGYYGRPDYHPQPDDYPKPHYVGRPGYYGRPEYPGRDFPGRDYSSRSDYYPRRDPYSRPIPYCDCW
jgi:hypothetical protein